MKATKYMRENTQCPIGQWVDHELAKHANPKNLGEQCNAKVAVPLLKRFKTKLAKPVDDGLRFMKSPSLGSIIATSSNGNWIVTVQWKLQTYCVTGKSFDECTRKLKRLLK